MDPEPWLIPQDIYDKLMALPTGGDVSEFFEFEDPAWSGFTVTIFHVTPTGAVPGAAEDGNSDVSDIR